MRTVQLSARERVQVRAAGSGVWVTHLRPHPWLVERWMLAGESTRLATLADVHAYTSTCARELGLAVLSTWAEVVTMRRTRVRRLVAAGGEA